MKILMVSPKGERYMLKQGLSWTLFFFGFYGVPFIYRKMYLQGYLMLLSQIILCVITVILQTSLNISEEGKNAIMILITAPYSGFCFYMLFKGNKWTYDYLVSQGWEEKGLIP